MTTLLSLDGDGPLHRSSPAEDPVTACEFRPADAC
jgi:hypothetical protein